MEMFYEIAAAFQCHGNYLGEEPYGSGHINDTYKVYYEDNGQRMHYIRQRVNHNIFKDVPGLMENIGQVTRHQRMKFGEAGATGLDRRVLTLIPTVDGKDFYQDTDGNYWRTWHIASCANEEGAELPIDLNFLDEGTAYTATLYEDTDETHFETNKESYRVRTISLKKGDHITARLAPGGGHCMIVEPK